MRLIITICYLNVSPISRVPWNEPAIDTNVKIKKYIGLFCGCLMFRSRSTLPQKNMHVSLSDHSNKLIISKAKCCPVWGTKNKTNFKLIQIIKTFPMHQSRPSIAMANGDRFNCIVQKTTTQKSHKWLKFVLIPPPPLFQMANAVVRNVQRSL